MSKAARASATRQRGGRRRGRVTPAHRRRARPAPRVLHERAHVRRERHGILGQDALHEQRLVVEQPRVAAELLGLARLLR